MKGKFMMTLKVFWLFMLVAQEIDGFLIQLAYFIFILIEVDLILIKLLNDVVLLRNKGLSIVGMSIVRIHMRFNMFWR